MSLREEVSALETIDQIVERIFGLSDTELIDALIRHDISIFNAYIALTYEKSSISLVVVKVRSLGEPIIRVITELFAEYYFVLR